MTTGLGPRTRDHGAASEASLPGHFAQLAGALPGLLAIAGAVALIPFEGAFPPTVWYPAGLFLLVLLAVATLAGAPRAIEGPVRVALVLFALFWALSCLSVIWAESPAEAWEGANRIAVYGLLITVVAVSAWQPVALTAALIVVAFGTAAIAAGVVVSGALAEDPSNLLVGGQLDAPIGYANATANAWLLGLAPALALVASRSLPWPVRGLALAAAVCLAEVTLIPQSRGALAAGAIMVGAYLLIGPRRLVGLLSVVVVAGLSALFFGGLSEIYESERVAELPGAFDSALRALLLSAAIAFALGCVGALADDRVKPHEPSPRARRAGRAVAIAGVVAAIVAVVVAIGDPYEWASTRWEDFRESGYSRVDDQSTRFGGSLGSGRYDFYRVALNQFQERPLFGAGADNFAVEYLRERRTAEAPRHPHSLAMRLLSQHGAVGTLLFVGFLVALLVSVARLSRSIGTAERVLVSGALGCFLAWFIHVQADWLWAFPSLGAIGLGMLTAAARTGPARPALPSSSTRRAFVVLPAILVLGVSFALPGLAARYISAAYEESASDSAAALERLERAADLNPLASEPLIAKGIISNRVGREVIALDSFRRATDRDPSNWFAWLERGLTQALAGERAQALESLAVSQELNPRQELVTDVRRRVRSGREVDPADIEATLFGQLRNRLRATGDGE